MIFGGTHSGNGLDRSCGVESLAMIACPPLPRKQPYSYYYPLFEYMSHAHGLTLLDSELEDIIQTVKRMTK